jgi:hypothetical protein
MTGAQKLFEQVLRHNDALHLIGAFVDLSGLTKLSTTSTVPVIVRRIVRSVHAIKGNSSEL